uniref:Uncharacterized protein n=1 Tax=Rhizophora mucronata TaxID=61149 RepID=A0A2P2QN13_RHIMU
MKKGKENHSLKSKTK